jgi:hypothetical protein
LPDASPRSCSFTGTLRKSQERSRKMTRTNHYRRGLVLLAAGLLALLAFSVPALGKQSDLRQQSALGADKKDAAVAIQSSTTAPKASFASGSGFNFLGVKVSDHGNLISFESPVGRQAVFGGREGYAVCSGGGGTVHGHDTGDVEGGFAAPTFSQPTAGAFPLTVTRRTTDGKFQLTQVWNKPDPVEMDVTVTMTLKNISGAPINSNVLLSRSGDFDIGDSSSDRGAETIDSAWLWDDAGVPDDVEPVGVMLTALTFDTDNAARIETQSDWLNGRSSPPLRASRLGCNDLFTETPTPEPGDFAMRIFYLFEGGLGAGQSKTVKFEYGRI